MKHPRVTPLIGRISAFAPVLAALTLGWSSLPANADALTDLDNVIQQQYAAQEGVPVTFPAVVADIGTPDTVTAPATDLVYAVYQLAQTSKYNTNSAALTSLITGALMGVESNADGSPKYLRADLNVIAPRVLNAALLGSGFTGGLAVTVTQNLVNLNSQFPSKTQLTVAGKQAVLAQGIKSLGADTANAKSLGQFAFTVFSPLAPATANQVLKDAYVQYYAGGLLKLVGNATAAVPGFTQGILSSATVAGDDHTVYALKIAEYAAANPAAAGAVIGGRALDLGTNATSNDYTQLLRSAFNDAKLAAVKIPAFASVATILGNDQTNLGNSLFDTTLPASLGAPVAKTTLNKAIVTSGVIQGLVNTSVTPPTSGQIINVVNNIAFIGTALKATEYSGFAGIAALGTGDSAGLLARVLINEQFPLENPNQTVAVDTANRVAIAVATLKAIAPTSPSSGEQVAIQVISTANGGSNSTGSGVFSTDTQLILLGKTLAYYIKATNGGLIGSTVEGVASQLTNQTASVLADYVTAVVPFAPAGALNITQAITSKLILPGGSTSSSQFATILAGKIGLAYSLNGMAGIAAADPNNAGSIATAIATSPTLKPYSVYFAAPLASAIPEDRVVDVAQAIANLLKPYASRTAYNNPNDPNNAYDSTVDTKVPTIASISTLAANVAKVIQTKPLMPTVNRTVELSELAATLVGIAVQKIPAGTSDALTAKAMEPTVAAIGAAVIAALSPKLLQNDATFAADQQDAVKQIAGAVAQAVAASTSLTDAQKHALLDQVPYANHPGVFLPGALEAALLARTAAQYKALVSNAFVDVRQALNDQTNPTHIVPGSYAPGANGAYASGNVFELETPVANTL